MDIYRLIHILIRKSRYLIAIPLVAGILMIFITRNQPRVYSAKASIFTAITSNFSIDNLGNSRVDFFATKTAYNNLLSILSSRSVIEETSLRLFAMHLMLDQENPIIISKESFYDLQKIVPDEIRKLVVKGDEEKTFKNLLNYTKQDKSNFLYGLLNYTHPHYSYKTISKNIKIAQVGSSDIVELSYQLNDPGIVYQTLRILIEVFLKEYSVLKKSQTNAVVEYFEMQLKNSSSQLNTVEDNLLAFNKKNSIINYYEQTKHVSSQQEKIEVKLQDVLMEFQSAEAILKKLEVETQSRFKININTKDILDIRKSLIVVNQKLAQIEMDKDDPLQTTPLEVELREIEYKLRTDLQGKIDSIYVYGRNSEGMAIETLLNNWLKTVIEYEGARARLIAMQKKNKEFSKLYAQYAPLGATLKRIEREIDVKEKEYLEILHHLGLAKLKQQNEEMMANMKILDHPQLPIDPKSTKRKLYVVVIGIFAFILTLLGIVVFELLDRTLKTPKRFGEVAKLKVSGAFANNKIHNGVDISLLNTKGLKLVIESIVNSRNQQPGKPVIAQFISHWKAEGKTTIIQLLAQQLDKIGYLVTILDLRKSKHSANSGNMAMSKDLYDVNSYIELIRQTEKDAFPDIVLVEIPAVSDEVFNTKLLSTATLSYFIANAKRSWSFADDFLLNNQKEKVAQNLLGILNNVHPDEMIDIVGEIPRKRSWLRKLIKGLILSPIKSGNKY